MGDIHVFLTTGMASPEKLKGTSCVVVDILRATSCWVTAIAHGALVVHPVVSLDECRSLGKDGYLTAAERGGEKITGFTLGNSPFEYTTDKVAGKKIAVTTTNGSKTLHQAKYAEQVYIGSFLNIDTMAAELAGADSVSILCSGWEGGPGIEDILFAGELVHLLSATHTFGDDAALIALEIFNQARHNVPHFLSRAAHVKRLLRLGLKNDIDYCLQKNIYRVIPILHYNEIVLKGSY